MLSASYSGSLAHSGMRSLASLLALCSVAALLVVCLGNHHKGARARSGQGQASQLVSAALREYIILVEDSARELRSTIDERLHSHFLDRLSGGGKDERDDESVKEMVERLKEDISLAAGKELRFNVTAIASRLLEDDGQQRSRRASRSSRKNSKEEEDEESVPSAPSEAQMQTTWSILESLSSFMNEFVSNVIVTLIIDPVLEGFLEIAELLGVEDSAEVAVFRGIFAGCSTLIRNGREATQQVVAGPKS